MPLVNEDVKDIHKQCGLAVDAIIKACAQRKACDNLTAVIIGFDGFDNLLHQHAHHLVTDMIEEDEIEEITLEPLLE